MPYGNIVRIEPEHGFGFESVLRAISKQIYETPLAFIRENVQNAVDAVRIQAARDQTDPADAAYRIEITADEKKIVVQDNGTGMSPGDLENFFWTIGASGKRTPEAIACMMLSGSSLRGLSLVITTASARRDAASPISGRLPGSRSPPQPITQVTRPCVTCARSARSTCSSASGVCA